eukprot:1159718-Pelagomonas_calceolata.AAC.4
MDVIATQNKIAEKCNNLQPCAPWLPLEDPSILSSDMCGRSCGKVTLSPHKRCAAGRAARLHSFHQIHAAGRAARSISLFPHDRCAAGRAARSPPLFLT